MTLPPAPPANPPPKARWDLRFGRGESWAGILLVLATVIAYLPAIAGGFVWNDEAYVTRPDLQTLAGLRDIWIRLGATEQYYPLLHSAFWVEHRLWGDAPAWYHAVNVLWHALAACLLVAVLQRLAIPGAWLAGLVFALHPVCVESVAWVTEQKNTLSTVFYLLAALAYLRYDRGAQGRQYALAIAWFVLALCTKTVTATLPAALLVVLWWKRGALTWKRDAAPLLPWFALGAASGVLTTWVERTYIGAEGSEFALTLLDRCLLAGRAFWFYLGKLLWPANLIFIYPHWTVDSRQAWQFLPSLAVLALVLILWRIAARRAGDPERTRAARAPLAGFLFFTGTLFPVLGLFNVYAFKFSYVADHFQYLASLGILVPLAAALAWLLQRLPDRAKGAAFGLGGALLAVLGTLSWQQCAIYRDAETLYRSILERNPASWMAHNNLGAILVNKGRFEEARMHIREALRLRPVYADAECNLAAVELHAGRFAEATRHSQAAARLHPGSTEIENNLALALAESGDFEQAIVHYREAIRIRPEFATAHDNLGNVLMRLDREKEAIAEYEKAVRLAPSHLSYRAHLGFARAEAEKRAASR